MESNVYHHHASMEDSSSMTSRKGRFRSSDVAEGTNNTYMFPPGNTSYTVPYGAKSQTSRRGSHQMTTGSAKISALNLSDSKNATGEATINHDYHKQYQQANVSGIARQKADRTHSNYNNQQYRRQRSTSTSSSDLYFIERQKHKHQTGAFVDTQPPPPRNYKYKGALKVDSMVKKYKKVPCDQTNIYPGPNPYIPPTNLVPPLQHVPFIPMPPPQPPFMHCTAPFFDVSAQCGNGSGLYPPPFMTSRYHRKHTLPGGTIENLYGGNNSRFSNYPPLPAGAKIVAQYVKELNEIPSYKNFVSSSHSSQMQASNSFLTMNGITNGPHEHRQNDRCEKLIETCAPKKKIIEVYQKHKKKRYENSINMDKMKDDIIASITQEIKKFDRPVNQGLVPVAQDTQQQVKVIVQPIQPVFYMPQNVHGSSTAGDASVSQQFAGKPQVVYVPRNVYVPVVKPVFVPKERVIVRPQIVHVARPIVIDRPVPVTQRPIIIDRDRPIPIPVRSHLSSSNFAETMQQDVIEEHANNHYVFNDNVPMAYGGRTGEFAYGLNYGYQPKDDKFRYIISGCDGIDPLAGMFTSPSDLLRQREQLRLFNSSRASSLDTHIFNENKKQDLQGIFKSASTGNVNIEVLDPTIKPEWESIDAQLLMERYGNLFQEATSTSPPRYVYESVEKSGIHSISSPTQYQDQLDMSTRDAATSNVAYDDGPNGDMAPKILGDLARAGITVVE